mgnify:CR=1 FL=1
MSIWDQYPEDRVAGEDVQIEDKVFVVLEKLFDIRSKKKFPPPAKGKKKKKPFPELIPIVDDDTESD